MSRASRGALSPSSPALRQGPVQVGQAGAGRRGMLLSPAGAGASLALRLVGARDCGGPQRARAPHLKVWKARAAANMASRMTTAKVYHVIHQLRVCGLAVHGEAGRAGGRRRAGQGEAARGGGQLGSAGRRQEDVRAGRALT